MFSNNFSFKKPRKSNEHERDSFTSRVENLRCCNKYIFAQSSYPITWGRSALNTNSCGVLLTGREESGENNFALSENQATGGANIFIFVLFVSQEYLESRVHLWGMQRIQPRRFIRRMRGLLPMAAYLLKNQMLSAKMLFCWELIYNTLAWHFRASHYCATTSWLTFGPITHVFMVFSNYCYVLLNKPSRRFYFCLTVFLV